VKPSKSYEEKSEKKNSKKKANTVRFQKKEKKRKQRFARGGHHRLIRVGRLDINHNPSVLLLVVVDSIRTSSSRIKKSRIKKSRNQDSTIIVAIGLQVQFVPFAVMTHCYSTCALIHYIYLVVHSVIILLIR